MRAISTLEMLLVVIKIVVVLATCGSTTFGATPRQVAAARVSVAISQLRVRDQRADLPDQTRRYRSIAADAAEQADQLEAERRRLENDLADARNELETAKAGDAKKAVEVADQKAAAEQLQKQLEQANVAIETKASEVDAIKAELNAKRVAAAGEKSLDPSKGIVVNICDGNTCTAWYGSLVAKEPQCLTLSIECEQAAVSDRKATITVQIGSQSFLGQFDGIWAAGKQQIRVDDPREQPPAEAPRQSYARNRSGWSTCRSLVLLRRKSITASKR